MDIAGKLLSTSCFRRDPLVLAEAEVACKSTPIRLDGIGRQAQIPLNLEPGPGMLLLGNQWVAFPMDIRHGQRLPMRKELLFFFSVLYWMSCIPRNIDENAAKNILAKALEGTLGHRETDERGSSNAWGEAAPTPLSAMARGQVASWS